MRMNIRRCLVDSTGCVNTVVPCICLPAFPGEFFHQVHLNSLNFNQVLPLVNQQVVELLVNLAYLQFSFQIDTVIVLFPEGGLWIPDGSGSS